MKWIYLIAPILTAGGEILELPGPYEMQGSILAVLQFIFTMMMFIGKYRAVRLISSFLAAIFGGSAFVVYYLNQTSVGNPLSLGPLLFFGAGVIYGTIVGVITLRKVIQERRYRKEIEERFSKIDMRDRRFED